MWLRTTIYQSKRWFTNVQPLRCGTDCWQWHSGNSILRNVVKISVFWHLCETYLSLWQHIGHHRGAMLGAEIGSREEVFQASDQYTSTQGMQHIVSPQHLPGSMTPNSVSPVTGKQHVLAHPGASPPTFFMNIITSDSLNWPLALVPIVSCKLPYTWGSARETKSPSRSETEAASLSIFWSNCWALSEALSKSFRKSTI